MRDLLFVASMVALTAVVVWGLVALTRLWRPAASPPTAPATTLVERRVVVTLDVARADSVAPAVLRLVHETAARMFAAMPDVEEVEVRARDGSVLGCTSRVVSEPRTIWLPEFLYEPHPRRHHGPDLSGHLGEDEPFVPPVREGPIELPEPAPSGAQPSKPPLSMTERLDLVPAIRTSVRSPDDPVDVIRAILDAGGLTVDVDDDLLLVDSLAIAVVRHVDGVAHEALNHAYRRIAASRAERGLVVCVWLCRSGGGQAAGTACPAGASCRRGRRTTDGRCRRTRRGSDPVRPCARAGASSPGRSPAPVSGGVSTKGTVPRTHWQGGRGSLNRVVEASHRMHSKPAIAATETIGTGTFGPSLAGHAQSSWERRWYR